MQFKNQKKNFKSLGDEKKKERRARKEIWKKRKILPKKPFQKFSLK